jgi:hypothetical protein
VYFISLNVFVTVGSIVPRLSSFLSGFVVFIVIRVSDEVVEALIGLVD